MGENHVCKKNYNIKKVEKAENLQKSTTPNLFWLLFLQL